ncbi:MAG: Uma2 family endonuclease [Nitrospirae bacterium]|nr:Uma2 family endonuclease [Nitrospirota bacterium]
MSAVAEVRFNYRDYCLMPEGKRYELIGGRLYVTPSPYTVHQGVSREILNLLYRQLHEPGIAVVFTAPVDVYLTDEDVIQPDLLAIAKNRAGIVEDKYVRGAPDLVVEIISQTHPERDRVIKKKLYHLNGVKEYWIVDPDARSIEVLDWRQGGWEHRGTYTQGEVTSSVFPALVVPLDRVF